MTETCRVKEVGRWHLGKGRRQDSNPCYHVTHLSTPKLNWASLSLLSSSSSSSSSSSEGHREINELIADRGNVCDTAAFLSPSSCNDHHFLLSTQPLTLTAGYSESVWRTYLPFTPIFLAALPSLIPVVRWKPHYSKFEIHGGIRG